MGCRTCDAIHALATKYDLHPLAVEDVLHVTQRPKDRSRTAARRASSRRACSSSPAPCSSRTGACSTSQVSIFLGHKTVLTFQEGRSDVWDPIRQRIKAKGSRLRANDASFLAYSLLDAIVDRCFPILEDYSERAEELEDPDPGGAPAPT